MKLYAPYLDQDSLAEEILYQYNDTRYKWVLQILNKQTNASVVIQTTL